MKRVNSLVICDIGWLVESQFWFRVANWSCCDSGEFSCRMFLGAVPVLWVHMDIDSHSGVLNSLLGNAISNS